MKKLILGLMLLLLPFNAFARDIIPDMSEESVPVLNEELRQLRDRKSGYALVIANASFDPADATTYYFGLAYNTTFSTTATTINKVFVPRSGKIKKVYANFNQSGVLGTAETSTVYIRLNNTTDTVISSAVKNDSTPVSVIEDGLDINVSAGDYFSIKWVTPTWATNPTTFRIQAIVWIEY